MKGETANAVYEPHVIPNTSENDIIAAVTCCSCDFTNPGHIIKQMQQKYPFEIDNKPTVTYAIISYLQCPRNKMITTGYNNNRNKHALYKYSCFHLIFLSQETKNCRPTKSPTLYSVCY